MTAQPTIKSVSSDIQESIFNHNFRCMKYLNPFFATAFLVFSVCVFGAFSTVEPPAEVPSWTIDKGHSSVSFAVRHYFSNVIGTFDDFEGTLAFDPENLKESSIAFNIKVASVNTKNERRDGHLQSKDFFNAEQWPEMKFVSSSLTAVDDHFVVKGEMTIRDVTKTVEIPVKFLGQMKHPRREGSYIGGFSAEFTINRNDYGVGVGNWAATATIGGEVKVTINLEVNRSES